MGKAIPPFGSPPGLKGTGTAGRVPFWLNSKTLDDDSNLLWDDTNKRFRVGHRGGVPSALGVLIVDAAAAANALVLASSDHGTSVAFRNLYGQLELSPANLSATIVSIYDAGKFLIDYQGFQLFNNLGNAVHFGVIHTNGWTGVAGPGVAPHSPLQVGGAIAVPIATKTADYTITASNSTILGNATGGAITITLPTAAAIAGREYVIKKIDSSGNAVTVDGHSSETIDGAANYALATQWKYVKVQSDGTNWVVIGNN